MKYYLNNDWQFAFKLSNDFLTNKKFPKVRIPHTVKQIDYNYINEKDYETVCGYKKYLKYDKSWDKKRIFLCFDGVGHKTEVYLNNKLLKTHLCGYTGFKVELTKSIKKGTNLLFVKVDTRETLNVPPFGKVIDYLCYGGIYRDVYLQIEENDFIEDVYAYPFKTNNGYIVKNDVTINGKKGLIKYELLDKNKTIYKGESFNKTFEFNVSKIKEWTLEHPYLYKLRYYLNDSSDYFECNFAFKTMEFKADGFYLNGIKTKLVGLDRHQAYPYVGYAMPASMQKLDAHILKEELGLNVCRTSHYPQAHSFLDECDKIGLLVFTELPGWQHIGNKKWQDIAVKNVEDMVKQWRKHPSIILWGVRINESKDDDEFYKRTNAVAHKYDPFRPTTGVRDFKGSHLLEDVYAHNDFSYNGTNMPGLVGKANGIKTKENMNHAYIVTEYCGHMYPTKPFDDEIHRTNHALRHATVIDAMYENEDVSGCIGWCMSDYNTHRDFGGGDRICYHGVLDMFRNKKLASYVYASQQDKIPVLEVNTEFNAGDHPELNIRDVYIFSNGDTVKVYKNDKFMIELKPSKKFKNLPHPPFYIDDHIGELIEKQEKYDKESSTLLKKAILILKKDGVNAIPKSLINNLKDHNLSMDDVYKLNSKYIGGWGEDHIVYRFEAIKNGKVIKTVTKSSVESIYLEAKAYSNKLVENESYDVTEVFVKALDNNHNIAEYYQEALSLKTNGPIEIIGPNVVSLKAGQIGIYIKSIGKSGKASLVIESKRFKRIKINFTIEVVK